MKIYRLWKKMEISSMSKQIIAFVVIFMSGILLFSLGLYLFWIEWDNLQNTLIGVAFMLVGIGFMGLDIVYMLGEILHNKSVLKTELLTQKF